MSIIYIKFKWTHKIDRCLTDICLSPNQKALIYPHIENWSLPDCLAALRMEVAKKNDGKMS